MCRISGIINKDFQPEALQSIVQDMCLSLQHGGPDDEGIYQDRHLVLGNRRLSLLDLTPAGHQPMHYGDYVITYNGELYNFPALKEELQSLGHRFTNHTDTEVILAAFAQWNIQSFERFNGMFAFALYDKKQNDIYLVRDASGIKPLYYSLENEGLVFASEIRAFRSVPFLGKANNSWPVYLMAYGHLPEPVTTQQDIHPLHKGSFIKYNIDNGKHSIQSFRHFSYSTNGNGNNQHDDLYDSMQSAVGRQLVADAPIGVFLSGGLDSSIITTLASQAKHKNLNTLSLYFEEETYSEKKYQDALINKLQCNHYQHLLKEEEFHEAFPTILDSMDMPGCDGINTWFISKYARQQGLKAVLSGIGADELFGGYPSFHRLYKARMLQKIPGVGKLPKRKSSKELSRMAYLQIEGIKGLYLFLRGHYTPREIAKQLGADENEIWNILKESPVLPGITGLGAKNQASWMELNLYMQNQLLRDADVMSMIHGVEIRVPFLDNAVVKLALQTDPEIKYAGMPKKLLIDTFKKDLPDITWNRPKMGFSFPFAKWLANSSYVKNLITNGNAHTKKNYTAFMSGRLHWSQIMSLVILRKNGFA